MASRAQKYYGNSPRLERGEDGRMMVAKKPISKMAEKTDTEDKPAEDATAEPAATDKKEA